MVIGLVAVVAAIAAVLLVYRDSAAERERTRFCSIDEMLPPKANDPEALRAAQRLIQDLMDPTAGGGSLKPLEWDKATVMPYRGCEWRFAAQVQIPGPQACQEPVRATVGYDPASRRWRLVRFEFHSCLKQLVRPG
jgi:hypothetical protein